MAVVGTAEVVIRAITNKVRSDIQRAFNDARPDIRKAGSQAGEDFAQGFNTSLRNSLGDSLTNAFIELDGLSETAGHQAGGSYGSNFAETAGTHMADVFNDVDLGNGPNQAGQAAGNDIVSGIGLTLPPGAEAAGDEAGRRLARGLQRGAGSGGNRDFFQRVFGDSFAASASSAAKSFTLIYSAGQLLAPLIATLIGAISSLISGLFAMAAAAAQAAGALAALPGLLVALVQAGGALKLAFSGVGAAIKAGTQAAAASASGSSAEVVRQAQAVADAQTRLSRAYEDAATSRSEAAQRVQSAEEDLAQAQEDSRRAQEDLNQARKDAVEDLQQLAFDAEDASLAEQRAALNLEDAYKKLQETRSKPTDLEERQRAELDLKQAELDYRKAKDRNADITKSNEAAAKAGVEGTQRVVDAKKRVNDANQRQHDAEVRVAEAQLASAKAARASARAISDAAKALSRAQAAAKAGAGSQSAYNAALAKLTPSQAKFAKFMVGIRKSFDPLKEAVASGVFPALETQIKRFVNGNGLDVVERVLKGTGRALGTVITDFGRFLNSAETLRRVEIIGKANNKTIAAAGPIFKKLGSVATGVLVAINTRIDGNKSLMERFIGFVDKIAGKLKQAFGGKDDIDKMARFFKRAGDTAAVLGHIIGGLFTALFHLGKAATGAGDDLLTSFSDAVDKLNEMIDAASRSGELQDFFAGVAENTKKIASFLGAISKAFLAIGDNPGIGKAFDELQAKAVPAVESIADKLIEVGPELARFGIQVAKFIDNITSSGGMEVFINTLTFIGKLLNAVFGNPFARTVGAAIAIVFGFTRALALFRLGIVLVGKIVIGNFRNMTGAISTTAGAFGKLRTAIATIRTEGLAAGLRGLKGASDTAMTAFDRQMVTDNLKVESLARVEAQALRTAGALRGTLAQASQASSRANVAGSATPGAPRVAGQRAAERRATGQAAAAGETAVANAIPAGTIKNVEKVGVAAAKSSKGVGKLIGSLGVMSTALIGVSLPVAAVIAGVAALVFIFVKLLQRNPQVVAALKVIGDKLKELGSFILDKVLGAFELLGRTIIRVMNFCSGIVRSTIDFIVPKFVTLIDLALKVAHALHLPTNGLEDAKTGALNLQKAVHKVDDTLQGVNDQLGTTHVTSGMVKDAANKVADAYKDVNTELEDAIDNFSLLNGVAVDQDEAASNYQASLDDLASSLKENGKSLDINTEKGRANRDALRRSIEAINEKVSADFKNNASTKGVSDATKIAAEQLGLNRKELIKVATQSGLSETAARKYVNQLLKTPSEVATAVNTPGLDAANKKAADLLVNMKALNLVHANPKITLEVATSLEKQDQALANRGPQPNITINVGGSASGGTVKKTSGGVLRVLGEGGQDERIEPLDGNGLSAGDRMLIAQFRQLSVQIAAKKSGGGDGTSRGQEQIIAELRAIRMGLDRPNGPIIVKGHDQPKATAQEIVLAQRRRVLEHNYTVAG